MGSRTGCYLAASFAGMPFAHSGSLRVYYESAGDGPAVLLILGQGLSLEAGWRTIELLSTQFRVLAFDNRDMGRSDRAMWPYLVSQMAGDAVAVLDAAEEPCAHVYGISLGGMVAQEIALRHPDRVGALVLGATTPGGPRAIPPGHAGPDVLQPRRGDGTRGSGVGVGPVHLRRAHAPPAWRTDRRGHRPPPDPRA